jgi:Uma2 family endonuclease
MKKFKSSPCAVSSPHKNRIKRSPYYLKVYFRKEYISSVLQILTIMIKHLSDLDINGSYSYADYLSWRFEERVELIKGRLVPMASPLRLHQKASKRIQYQFEDFLTKNPCGCEVYNAPFDVRFPTNPSAKKATAIYTVVQPDLCVICDAQKLDDKGCLGAPDLIVEIISKGTQKKDRTVKRKLYEEFGVKEFWIVYPNDKMVEVFLLNENGTYNESIVYDDEDSIVPSVLPALIVDLEKVFAE